jgi:hypothetical protein
MARNFVVNIDDLLADERLQKLFQQLNLTEDNQKKLCEAFQHYFMTSTSTDMYLNNPGRTCTIANDRLRRKKGGIQRSCTASAYDACTRNDTVGKGFCIRRSYKNAK